MSGKDDKKDEISVEIVEQLAEGIVDEREKEKEREKGERSKIKKEEPSVPLEESRVEAMSDGSDGGKKGGPEEDPQPDCGEYPGFEWDDPNKVKETCRESYDRDLDGALVEDDLHHSDKILDTLNFLKDGLRILQNKDKQRLYGNNYKECPMPEFPHPTKTRYKSLENSHDFKLVEYNFPRIKFSGKPGPSSPDIHQFMTQMKHAQEFCPVHPKDFRRVLLMRLAPPALGMVHGWFSNPKTDLRKAINRLYDSFANNIDSDDARSCMKKFEVPKGTKFSIFIAELEFIGGFASRGGTNPEENSLLVSLLCQEGLEHGLPEAAYRLCFHKICEIREDLGREPYMEEIMAGLSKIKREVDFEMNRAKGFTWGRDREFFMHTNKLGPMHKTSQSSNTNSQGNNYKGKKFTPKVNAVQTTQTNSKQGKPSGQQGQKKNVFQKAVKGQNSAENEKVNYQKQVSDGKKECSFCKERTHTCSSGCWSCKDDNKKQYQGPPAQEACKHCLKAFKGEQLFHPMDYCPIRPAMLAMYKKGELKPRGMFKDHVERLNKKK